MVIREKTDDLGWWMLSGIGGIVGSTDGVNVETTLLVSGIVGVIVPFNVDETSVGTETMLIVRGTGGIVPLSVVEISDDSSAGTLLVSVAGGEMVPFNVDETSVGRVLGALLLTQDVGTNGGGGEPLMEVVVV